MFRIFKIFILAAAALWCVPVVGQAAIAEGDGWRVIWNTPLRSPANAGPRPNEFDIRDVIIARLDELKTGDWCGLATYTFSANSERIGGAGPIINAMSNALARGATLVFVGGNGVSLTSNYWPNVSLNGLMNKYPTRFAAKIAPNDGGIMHHKLCVSYYGTPKKHSVISGSWNFTGAASSYQWNIMTEIESQPLAAAYSNEIGQLMNGYFHANANKSHAYDETTFSMNGMTTGEAGWVRFGPYPEYGFTNNNALRDIRTRIQAADEEIFFSLNKLTINDIADDLIAACNRGVFVRGVIPMSDRTNDSANIAIKLLDTSNYTSANRVQLYLAYLKGNDAARDDGYNDLVHTKYMLVDPRGDNPWVIHGSANWTQAGLIMTNRNDENILFIPHQGMAAAFLGQFDAMTDKLYPSFETLKFQAQTLSFTYWLPDTNSYRLVQLGPWNAAENEWPRIGPTNTLPVQEGTNTFTLPLPSAPSAFWKIEKVE